MRDQVLRYIRRCRLMKAGDRLLVAVSGGADSVALLRVLLELRTELGVVLAVAHLNHGLRGEDSDADEHFVGDLARHHELEFLVEHRRVDEYAADERMGLESAGRKLRYEWLTKAAGEHRFDAVATAHTLDDQAETVLMKFLRGAGSRGLAGIYPEMVRGHDPSGEEKKRIRFIRPLLSTTRAEVEAYLASIDQPWREDESNRDRRFRRNRVRHELLPLLEGEYNPNIRRILSETAEISRGEEDYWREVTDGVLKKVSVTGQPQLRLTEFRGLAPAVQRRVLKRFLERQGIAFNFQHIEAMRGCIVGGTSQVELPEGWEACREADVLSVRHPEVEPTRHGYLHKLPVPGEIEVPEIGCVIRVVPVPASLANEAELGTLLNAGLIGDELWVRNWRPGDRYHPSYMGKEQKLKTLFLEWSIPASARPLWPLLLKESDVVWVRELPVSQAYCWRPGDGDALLVECSSR